MNSNTKVINEFLVIKVELCTDDSTFAAVTFAEESGCNKFTVELPSEIVKQLPVGQGVYLVKA